MKQLAGERQKASYGEIQVQLLKGSWIEPLNGTFLEKTAHLKLKHPCSKSVS